MNPFFIKYPSILKKLYPNRITRLKEEKTIYLTFDDGPVPEITPWVLEQLKQYNANATFFCIGDNIRKNPEIFRQLIEEEHSYGNHTFNHLNGWKTPVEEYIQNTLLAEKEIEKFSRQKVSQLGASPQGIIRKIYFDFEASLGAFKLDYRVKLFRPPYGKIKNSQAAKLVKLDYKIVMWDVLSGDFDSRISEENCYKNVIKNATEGSTIVFHDSLKGFKNLHYTLPKVLDYYTEKGFSFKTL
jgi:peptidoglycan/xylan/chitin deacetylase (PgdA/CDA1 family)